VHFSGKVFLGVFVDEIAFPDGRTRQTGIYNAEIHNCRIHDNIYINRVHASLSNYIIKEYAIIENVDSLTVEGESAFGNGVRVIVMNEAGGREVPIYNDLSPQIAYIFALQRHRPQSIKALEQMLETEVGANKSTTGCIGKNARIENCGVLRNVNIGDAAELSGVKQLENGSIISDEKNPVRVGSNVIASDFIFAGGVYIHSSAFIHKCFVGAGSNVGIGFSAKNCLLFGVELAHGEADSIFAGPNTASSHKSTLLIAGMLSFFNAGSGTNQSNHKYKLGAVHQGIFERGCKTGSNAYLLWPSRLAPFTTILGRHARHLDTSEFPFSLLIEEGNKSMLIPALILQNIGLWRDDIKWRERMLQKDATIRGRTTVDIFSPFTVWRMLKGLRLLQTLRKKPDKKAVLNVQEFYIKNSAIARGIALYEAAIALYTQKVLLKHFARSVPSALKDFHSLVRPRVETSKEWVDAAGMLMPKNIFSDFMEKIEHGDYVSLEDAEDALASNFENYENYEWSFVVQMMEEKQNKKVGNFTPRDIVQVLIDSLHKSAKTLASILTDAGKEFNKSSQTSYGIDANPLERREDFESVRGVLEMNDYVRTIKLTFYADREKVNHLVKELEHIQL
jgi:hypothetical protein